MWRQRGVDSAPVVACRQAGFAGLAGSVVPFRVALKDLVPWIRQAQDTSCWLAFRACLEQTHGISSLSVRALEQALSQAKRVLLMFDGLDEVQQSSRHDVSAWIARLAPTAVVILTSRPTAMEGGTRRKWLALGFEGRCVSGLSPTLVQILTSRTSEAPGHVPTGGGDRKGEAYEHAVSGPRSRPHQIVVAYPCPTQVPRRG